MFGNYNTFLWREEVQEIGKSKCTSAMFPEGVMMRNVTLTTSYHPHASAQTICYFISGCKDIFMLMLSSLMLSTHTQTWLPSDTTIFQYSTTCLRGREEDHVQALAPPASGRWLAKTLLPVNLAAHVTNSPMFSFCLAVRCNHHDGPSATDVIDTSAGMFFTLHYLQSLKTVYPASFFPKSLYR